MEIFEILICLVFLVLYIYLLVKFVTLCNDARDIKNTLIRIEQHFIKSIKKRKQESFGGREFDASEKFKAGDLVVEKETQKQLRLHEKNVDGEWICYSCGQYYKTLKETELLSWNEYLEKREWFSWSKIPLIHFRYRLPSSGTCASTRTESIALFLTPSSCWTADTRMSFRFWQATQSLKTTSRHSWTHGKVGQWSSWRVR